jgi:hypothetical protein
MNNPDERHAIELEDRHPDMRREKGDGEIHRHPFTIQAHGCEGGSGRRVAATSGAGRRGVTDLTREIIPQIDVSSLYWRNYARKT